MSERPVRRAGPGRPAKATTGTKKGGRSLPPSAPFWTRQKYARGKTDYIAEVSAYCQLAERHSPIVAPLTVRDVATALGVNRDTLYRAGVTEEQIAPYAARQAARSGGSTPTPRSRAVQVVAQRLKEELAVVQGQLAAHLERWVLLEWNARRLGLDPEELTRPMPKPNRSTSRAGRRPER